MTFYCVCDSTIPIIVFFRIVTLPLETNNMTSLNKYVEVKTDLAGGVPVFKGTRVTVKTLFDYLEEESLEEFLIGFPTSLKLPNALSKFSAISSANTSGSGRLSKSASDLSFNQVISKEVLSLATISS
jgi:uncharacterized protein (DUF433 family)